MAWGCSEPWSDYGQCSVPAPNAEFIAVAGGYYHSLGLKGDGSIVAWGRNNQAQTIIPSPNTDFIAVAAGYYHSLGLKADGSIVAWGNNEYGQTNVPSPNTDFIAVAGGYYHSLGLKADGSIVAWGYNYYGQCNVPVPNADFIAVGAGDWHSLGLKADGSIVAWGWNDYGQTNVPSPNSGFITVASGGGSHSLALKRCTADKQCDDSVPCTIDICHVDTGTCLYTPDHSTCDDGLFCNGSETCGAAGCVVSVSPCAPAEVCDEDSDECLADCNRNGVPDDEDIAVGTSGDCDSDHIPDECEADDDVDGVVNDCDSCPDTLVGITVGLDGCPVPFGPCCLGAGICVDGTIAEDCERVHGSYLGDGLTCTLDPDRDGVSGCDDRCPLDAPKTAPGVCGCAIPDLDGDHDGIIDCIDPCPPIGFPDRDGDGVCDFEDGCADDPYKGDPGVCGCGVPDDDDDADGVADCKDLCPNTSPHVPVNGCGCAALGACCFYVGVCFNRVSVDTCETIEGVYQGDGSACSEGCWFGDFDGDGAVDLRDFAVFQHCFGADDADLSDGPCGRGDIDRCQDIDLLDYDAFRRALTGP